jgi:murein L,D-transpeptidase YafK
MNKRLLLAGLFIVAFATLFAFRNISSRTSAKRSFGSYPTGSVYVIVDKSDYELHVYDEEGWYATYPVVFGNKQQGDKMMEGDRKTPEGSFRITGKRPHNKWNKIMLIDYPNKESWEKFNRRKAQGLIPKTAKIGGGIGIHGTWPNDNIVVDDYKNWTQGCVSLRNVDMDEIYQFIQPGTRVIIRK